MKCQNFNLSTSLIRIFITPVLPRRTIKAKATTRPERVIGKEKSEERVFFVLSESFIDENPIREPKKAAIKVDMDTNVKLFNKALKYCGFVARFL